MKNILRIVSIATWFSLSMLCVLLTGCGLGLNHESVGTGESIADPSLRGVHGSIHSGQQPITNATIQLYAANLTGYGLAADPLLTSSVESDASGNFTIAETYSCPYPTSLLYLTATGGNPGAGTNANSLLMAPVGSCANLNASTFIAVNELTTIVGAYLLSPFMSSPTQLSTSEMNYSGLDNAFTTANMLVNPSTGISPGAALPAGATAPTEMLNTLADVIAACVNTAGIAAGVNSPCSTLFAASVSSSGTMPADTFTAALNIVKNATANVSTLFNMVVDSAPFQPTLASAPTSFLASIRYAASGEFSAPSAMALDARGNLWVANAGNNTVTMLAAGTGAASVFGSAAVFSTPSGVAIDSAGNAWVTNRGNNSVAVVTPSGASTVAASAGLKSPTALAIDGQGYLWVTNSEANTLSGYQLSGLNLAQVSTFVTGASGPVAIAVNPH